MKKIIINAFVLISFIGLAGMVQAQEKFNLEYRYSMGMSYKYESESKYSSEQEINGNEMKADGSTFSKMIMTVNDVAPDGNISFITSMEQMKMKVKMAMMDTTIEMKDLEKKGISGAISKYGKILKKEPLDTTKTGNSMLDNSGMLGSIFKEFAIFPGHELKIGDSWKEDQTDTAKGTQMVTKIHSEYTLVQVENKNVHSCVKIAFTGKMEIEGKMQQMGMDFFIEGSGDMSGTLWFDLKLGVIVAKETKTTQDLTMALTGQMQMTIPVTQNFNTTMTLVE
jgi:hypothetical protein